MEHHDMSAASWQPSLPERRGVSKHRLLTDAIVADIEAARLHAGTRMPTHRALARRLGISVQTVSLSYKEAERLGYLRGEVGRGTFVRRRVTERAGRFMLDTRPDEIADLSIMRAAYTEAHERAAREVMATLAEQDNSTFMRPCRPIAGLERHRRAARQWLEGLGVEAETDRILMTTGTAQAIFLAVASVVRQGDLVLTESLTDHGIIGLANVLGFTLRGLPTDEEGILVDAFAAACAAGGVRALVLIPTLGNPTSHVAGAERRRAIAKVAQRHGVFVIEDEVCKPLLDEPLPSLTALLPDLGFFATSLTKSIMTGLRVGHLVVPRHFSIRAASILRVTTWSAVNLPAEIATRWILDGTAASLLAVQRREARARQAIVAEELGPWVAGSHPLSLSAWLHLPERWTEEGLVRALAQRRVAVTPSDPFVVGDERPQRGLRICTSGRLSHEGLRDALVTIRRTLEQHPPVLDDRFAD
jgi:DNA-binding transcriptional MocR family regulator